MLASERLPCPKCFNPFTRLEREGQHIVQACVCGLRHYLLYVTRHGHELLHKAVRDTAAVLPERGSKRYRCLMAVYSGFPEAVSTEYIVERCRLTSKETSAFLIALMVRGLVDRVERRKGFPGGSLWRLSTGAEALLVTKTELRGSKLNGTFHRGC